MATVDGPSYGADRNTLRPTDYAPNNGVPGGHYSIGAKTGLMAAGIASAAQVFQIRWADTARLFVLERLTVTFSTATGFAATTLGAPVDLFIGHGSTASGSGGAALAFGSTANKMRASMSTTAFATSGEVRIATTAALTAATTQTLETTPIASCMGADNRTLVSTVPFDLANLVNAGDHPLILGTGDTLAICTNNPAATGTWYMAVTMSWIETSVY